MTESNGESSDTQPYPYDDVFGHCQCDELLGKCSDSKSGIIKSVTHSDWATPVVPVPKTDGTVRICGDYKLTFNKASPVEQYHIPPFEDLMVLPNLSTVLGPLHLLLKNVKWHWCPRKDKSFEAAKQLLQSHQLLVHFNSQEDLVLSCDASLFNLGVVLSHKYKDSNDKSLLGLFSELKAMSTTLSARMTRWCLILKAYKCTIEYKPGKYHGYADSLSRVPISNRKSNYEQHMCLMLDKLDSSPFTSDDIKFWTSRDPLLAHVREFVLCGWTEKTPSYRPFFSIRNEFTVFDGCIV
ncbi:uncharacterized protein LOC144350721 [Saccoglossus kowalevskii]